MSREQDTRDLESALMLMAHTLKTGFLAIEEVIGKAVETGPFIIEVRRK